MYVYNLDKETFEPVLENTIVNFMQCNNMLFSANRAYCATYKTNQTGFNIYNRKYTHDFRAKVDSKNFEGCLGLNVSTLDVILVSNINKIHMFDAKTFEEVKDNLIELTI